MVTIDEDCLDVRTVGHETEGVVLGELFDDGFDGFLTSLEAGSVHGPRDIKDQANVEGSPTKVFILGSLTDLDFEEDGELCLETSEDAGKERRRRHLDALEIKLGEIGRFEILKNLVVGTVETLRRGCRFTL